jgi:PAS domain S-box-containing protein
MKNDPARYGSVDALTSEVAGRTLPFDFFLELMDSIDDFVFLTDERLCIIKANRTASLQLGFSDVEFNTKHLKEIIAPQERRKMLRRIRPMRGRYGGETILMTKSRAALRVGYSISYLSSRDGKIKKYLFVCRPAEIVDLGEDRSGTYKLRRRILDSIGEPLFVIDFPARIICECNQCAVNLTGFKSSELIGRSMFEFMNFGGENHSVDSMIARVNESYAEMGFFQSRVFLARKKGTPIPCDCFSIPFFRDSGRADYTILALIDRSVEEGRKMLLSEFAARARSFAEDLAGFAAEEGGLTGGKRLSTQGFTPRQIEIARLVFEGRPSKEIGRALGISESTVKNHLAVMYKKIGATSRIDFLHKLIEDRIWIA